MPKKRPSYTQSVKKARVFCAAYANIPGNDIASDLAELLARLDNPKVRGIAAFVLKERIDTRIKSLESERVCRKEITRLMDLANNPPARSTHAKPGKVEKRPVTCVECEGPVLFQTRPDSHIGDHVCMNCGIVHVQEDMVEWSREIAMIESSERAFSRAFSKRMNEITDICAYPGRRFARSKKLEKAIEREIEREKESRRHCRDRLAKKAIQENIEESSEVLSLIKGGLLGSDINAWNALSYRQLLLVLETIFRHYRVDAIFNGDPMTGSLFTKKERMAIRRSWLNARFKLVKNWIYQPPMCEEDYDRAKEIAKLFVSSKIKKDKYTELRALDADQEKYERMNESIDARSSKDLFDLLQ